MSQSLDFIIDTTKKPKHVIFIGIDAGRYDYLERYPMPHVQSLIENGVSFRNAVTSNFPINTAPGFTSISTGSFSKDHGLFSSKSWYDKKTGKLRYFFDDKLGKIDMRAPTVCDAVKAVNPEAKIASISAKDRPAILLVGNNADIIVYSYTWTWPTREQLLQGRAREAYSGAGVCEDYYFWSERPNHQLPAYLKGLRLYRNNIDWKGDGFHHSQHDVGDTPLVDTFVMDAALQIVTREKPFLMCVTFVCPDIVGHLYTTHSVEMQAAMQAIDSEIGRLIDLLKKINWYEDSLVVISADHAMAKKDKFVSVIDELKKKGYHDIVENILHIITGTGGGLYLKDTSLKTLKKTIQVIQDMPHIEEAWYKYDPGAPWFVKRAAFDRAPDIFILPQCDAATVEAGEQDFVFKYRHGSPYPADANIMMIFSGAGVRRLGSIGEPLDLSSRKLLTEEEMKSLPEQVDVAPTMKRIMGLPI